MEGQATDLRLVEGTRLLVRYKLIRRGALRSEMQWNQLLAQHLRSGRSLEICIALDTLRRKLFRNFAKSART